MNHVHASAADQLLYKITHDLSETVRALVELPIWISEDLKDSGVVVSDDIQENLEALTVNGNRLAMMIDSLLIYSGVGKKQSQKVVILADMVAEILDANPLPQSMKITTNFSKPSVLSCEPDFSRLCQALLSNAVKHRDSETSQIALTITSDGQITEVIVKDDGPGIPHNFREKALSVLTTLKPRDEVEGSGMGLSVADKIASFYGGNLTLETPESDTERGLLVRVKLRNQTSGDENTSQDSASP